MNQSANSLSMNDLLKKHFSSEQGYASMKCDCCNHIKDCTLQGICKPKSISMTRSLIDTPEFLLIQVKRYSYESRKTKTNVWPEDVIHLSTGQTYQLSGIGHHLGETANSGHYVASLKTASGWIRCDDTKITFSDEKDIKSLLCDFCVYYRVKILDRINPPLKRVFNEDDFPPLQGVPKKRVI